MTRGGAVPELPPYDEYAERGVLGSILTQPDAAHSAALLGDLAPFLESRDFFRARHRVVYAGALSAYRRHGHALLGDVLRRLQAGGRLEAWGGAAALAGLAADALPALIVVEYARYVAALGLDRLLLEAPRYLAGPGTPPTPAALEAFNRRVQDKRARLAAVDAAARGERNTERNIVSASAGMYIPE